MEIVEENVGEHVEYDSRTDIEREAAEILHDHNHNVEESKEDGKVLSCAQLLKLNEEIGADYSEMA